MKVALTELAAGVGVLWTVSFIYLYVRERRSDRQDEVKMAFVMSMMLLGAWLFTTILVFAVGKGLLHFY